MSFILSYFKSADLYKIDAVKWKNCNIIGLETNWWKKSDPRAVLYEERVNAEAKLITGIFRKDLALVKEAMETKLINISSGISVVTDDPVNPNDIFEITEAKKYSSPEIAEYLSKIYNEKAEATYSPEPPNIIYPETKLVKVNTFGGWQPATVSEDKIRYIDNNYINFDGTKIIGVIKNDYNFESEILAKGIIEGNLDLVKLAVEQHKVIPDLNISLVTEEKHELRLNTLYEAKKRNYSDIVSYLQKAIADENKKGNEEFKKFQDVKKSDFEKWISSSKDYIKFSSPIEWESSSRLDKSILGITKTNVNAGRSEYEIPIDESTQPKKTDLQILNEEKLIRGILNDDIELVRSSLKSGTIEHKLVIGIVTYNPMCSKTRPFNAIHEALRKNNQDIISLLRNYKADESIFPIIKTPIESNYNSKPVNDNNTKIDDTSSNASTGSSGCVIS